MTRYVPRQSRQLLVHHPLMRPVTRVLSIAMLLLGALPLLPIQPVQAALVTPFTVRKTINAPGRIVQIGNTLLTCRAADAGCATALGGTGAKLNNNDFIMTNVDVDSDPTTFNSSIANLNAPAPGSAILFAGLYWGAYSTNAARFSVKFATPASGGYLPITGTNLGQFTNSAGTAYQGFADVTALVQAGGFGTYTVANVQATVNQTNTLAGWALVTIIQVPNDPTRNLTVFDGFGAVDSSAGNNQVDITVSGFNAPPAGPVHAQVGVVAYEGDLGLVGDAVQFRTPTTPFTTLAGTLNPANNFFNSSIDDVQGRISSKNPDFVNQLGFDISAVTADNLIPNSGTSATLRLTTAGDTYYPGVVTTAIDLFSPSLVVNKSEVDLNGGPAGTAKPGDIMEYTVTVQNTGLDFADNVTISESVRPTNFISGSLQVVSGPNAGFKTDAAGDDQAEFDPTSGRVIFRLGTGATATAGGSLAPAGQPNDRTTVRVHIQIPTTAYNNQQFSNSTPVNFTGRSSGQNFTVGSPPVTVTVATTADLAITKTHQGPIVPGGTVTYMYTITNNGPDYSDTDIEGSDLFPDGLTPFTGSGNVAGICAAAGQLVTCHTILGEFEPLPPGGSFSFTLTASVAPGTSPTVANTATVTSPGFDPDLSNNSSTDQAVGGADLVVTKSSSPNPYVPGQQLTYTVTVTNNGPNDVTGAKVDDPLPAALAGVGFTWTCSASGSNACGAASGTGDIHTTVNLISGGSATFAITGTVPSGATGELVNTATATVPTGFMDPNPGNNSATDHNNAARVSDLVVAKASSPNPYVPGRRLDYTVTVTNNGPSDVTNATVSDPLPPQLAGSNFGWTCATSGGASSCGAQSGAGSINTTVTLAAGATATFNISGTVPSGATGELVNTATATVPTGTTDPVPGNNTATDHNNAAPVSDLSLIKSSSPNPYVPGAPLTYTVVVTNGGPSDVMGAKVDDPLPAALAGAGFTWACSASGSNACGAASGTGDIHTTVNLISGGSATFTVTGMVPSGTTGQVTNSATITPPPGTSDPTPGNNTATNTNPTSGVADLIVTKTASVATALPGQLLTYTVTVKNNGPSDVTGASVSDALPAALSGAGFTWTCTAGGAGNACGPPSGSGNVATTVNLVSGGTAIVTVTGTVPANATGTLVNTAAVGPPAGTNDPIPGNNTATATTPVFTVAGPPGNGTAQHVHEPSGGTLQLIITNGGQDVTASATCTSSNPQIATVDASGKVHGITPGEVTMTCIYQGMTRTITVTIDTPGFTGIGANPAPQGRPSGAAVGEPTPPGPTPRAGGASGQGGPAPPPQPPAR